MTTGLNIDEMHLSSNAKRAAQLVLDGILRNRGEVVMQISHGMDGVHSRASIHYAGGAEDLVFITPLDVAVKQHIVDEWRASVGQDFDILFENPGTSNEHAHLEWQPKEPY